MTLKSYIFMSVEDAHRIHDRAVNRFGGRSGVRDFGLLESAINHPIMLLDYGDDSERELTYLAASYFFHIIKNHPFVDGNKRTGLLVTVEFLFKNGFDVKAEYADLYQLAVDTAASHKTKQDVSSFFKQSMRELV